VVLADVEHQTDEDKSMVASTALWGAVAGQLIFGSLADYIGRRKVLIATVILITLGAILSATCVKSTRFTIYQQLAVYRFLLGASR
jgi:MFS transporter, PHS family, inorganic phosphate transporter